MKNFHACATCINYRVIKEKNEVKYMCSRLGFETKPSYQFNCWDPKENVRRLIENEKRNA